MEKQGVLRISGPTSPKIGEKATYKVEEWYPSTTPSSCNPQRVIWELFKKRKNGEFTTTNIKKRGLGEFTFTSGTEKDIFRIEGYLYKAEGKEPMSIIVQPVVSDKKIAPVEGKVIESIKLTDTNGNPITKPLSYKDTIHVIAKCRNMAGETVTFSLWEDDEVGAGHNEKNQFITKSKPVIVDSKENARCDFMLFPIYMKLAQLQEDDDSLHEYYILVEYDNSKKASNNINVINLERRVSDKPKAPVVDSVKHSSKVDSTINKADSKGIIKRIYFDDKNYRRYISKTEHSDKIEVIVEGENLFNEEITINIWKIRPKLGVGFVPLGDDKADFELLFSEERLAFKDNNTGIYAFDLVTKTGENSNHNPLFCFTYEIFAEVIYNKISKKSQMLTTQLCAKPIPPENAISPAFESDTSKKENKSSCVCKQYDLIWGNKVSCEFRKKVVEIAKELWGESQKVKMANELMICMALETGKRFTADYGYPNSATGLIQFTDTAVADMNRTGYNGGNKITKEDLANLTAVQQLTYVKLYFDMWKTHYKKIINNSLDMYLTIWCPAATGKSDDYVCYSKERDIQNNVRHYESNKSIEYEYYDEKELIIENRLKKDKSLANGKIEKKDLKPRFRYWTVLGENNKVKSFTCQTVVVKKEEKNKVECSKCNENHYDLTAKVEWQTQFDSKWGDKKKQNVACKKTCDDILNKIGLASTSKDEKDIFQIALENNTHTKLIINKENSKKGISYMNMELEKGNPLQLGVDHKLGYGYNEGTTDHFIVIIGKGCENGKIYYRFYDVGTVHKDKGASDDNRLYLDKSDYSLKGKTVYNGHFYTVTQIRKNKKK
ncbi:hypothetical protein [Chishuiella sp.]|uniref:hypothetical protein n=1 Tax=Chishuiella sp. TaxID=1969467 RepID=UPI0028AFA1EF|nr:hypothetical protein [Chishuiella sp.]